jgi:hypothetical protein
MYIINIPEQAGTEIRPYKELISYHANSHFYYTVN